METGPDQTRADAAHLHPDVQGFAKAADAYERGRPGYPAAIAGWVVETTGLGPGTVVVDLAAGTGKFTSALLGAGSGATVVAVEPLEAMRAGLAALGVEVRDATAQSMGLGAASADVVTVAQAMHWFDTDEALTEIARVLRTGGWLVVVWNRRDQSDPLQAAISGLIETYRTGTPAHATGEWERVLDASPRFDLVAEVHLASEQVVDRAGLVDRVCSISFIANLPDEARQVVAEAAAELVPSAGSIPLRYVTEAFAYRRV